MRKPCGCVSIIARRLSFLDDFWGDYEWENVQEQMQRVFPEYKIKDLPCGHSIFHCYFDINEVVQVPGIGSWLGRGVTHEKGGIVPHYMGIQDKSAESLCSSPATAIWATPGSR